MISIVMNDEASRLPKQSDVPLEISTNKKRFQSAGYLPYGYRVPFDTLLGFNGEPTEPTTSYYSLGSGFRFFNPVSMRFVSSDTMSPFAAGGLNSYAYCLGDPINRHDPSGRFPVSRKLTNLKARIFPAKKNLPARVYEKKEVPQYVSYQNTPGLEKLNVVKQSKSVPDDYVLIGFHGSQKRHKQSLEAGVDESLLKRNLLGNGFYATTNYRHADIYAGKDGLIFGVYVKDASRWRVGVQFDRPGPDILLIRPSAFSHLMVRSDIRMPLKLIHPIKGDVF